MLPRGGVLLMDITYWGRDWGVLIIMDAQTGMDLWKKFVKNERLADYRKRVDYIELQGYIVRGIVCDGLKGCFNFSLYIRFKCANFIKSQLYDAIYPLIRN